METILLKIKGGFIYYIRINNLPRLCHWLSHDQHCDKAGIGANGSQQVHAHGVGEICLVRILPHFRRPYKKINEDWQHTGCQYLKFSYLKGTKKVIGHQKHGQSIDHRCKDEAAPQTQQQADGANAVLSVRFVLVDLGERIEPSDKEAADKHGFWRWVEITAQGTALVNEKEYQRTLADDDGKVSHDGTLFQADTAIAVGSGGEDVDGQTRDKIQTDQCTQQQGQEVHDQCDQEKLTGWSEWTLETSDRGSIPVHIAVVAVAGRIDQQMQNDEDEQGMGPVPCNHLAEGEPVDGHQEKGKVDTQ